MIPMHIHVTDVSDRINHPSFVLGKLLTCVSVFHYSGCLFILVFKGPLNHILVFIYSLFYLSSQDGHQTLRESSPEGTAVIPKLQPPFSSPSTRGAILRLQASLGQGAHCALCGDTPTSLEQQRKPPGMRPELAGLEIQGSSASAHAAPRAQQHSLSAAFNHKLPATASLKTSRGSQHKMKPQPHSAKPKSTYSC